MNFKILLKLTVILIFALTLVSCASASDVNETVAVSDDIDESVIEDSHNCEDVDSDVSQDQLVDENALDNHNASAVEGDIYNNNYTSAESHEFEIISHDNINNIEHEIETSDTQYYEDHIRINDNFINDDFSDINFKISEELFLDATSNYNTLLISTFEINHIFNDSDFFETSVLKTSDFKNTLLKDVKIKNDFSLTHDLIVYEYTQNSSFEEILNVVVCCNKATDNFAYSINNSVIGDDGSLMFCGSFFVNFNSGQDCLFFNNINIFCDFFH